MVDKQENSREDRLFDVLSSSDPALYAPEPDLSDIKSRVLSRVDLTMPNPKARRAWAVPLRLAPVGAVACCALAVGLGAGALSAGIGSDDKGSDVGVISVSGAGNAGQELATSSGVVSASRDAMSPSMWGGFGRAVYQADWEEDVPAFPGETEAFTYVPLSGEQAKEKLDAIVSVLKLKGDSQRSGESWIFTSTDGSQSLTVGGDALGSFYLSDYSGWSPCVAQAEPMPASGTREVPSSGKQEEIPPSPDCTQPSITATEKGSLVTAQKIVKALGYTVADFSWETEGWEDSPVQVFAYPEGKQDVSSVWSFTFYKNSVPAYANGYLAEVSSLGEYPIVTAEEALLRLNDPRFGPFYGGGVYSARSAVAESSKAGLTVDSPVSNDGSGSVSPEWVPTTPEPAKPGSAILWPVQEVNVVTAKLKLVQYWQTDGSVVLVPVYLMETREMGEVLVLAVADGSLNTATE